MVKTPKIVLLTAVFKVKNELSASTCKDAVGDSGERQLIAESHSQVVKYRRFGLVFVESHSSLQELRQALKLIDIVDTVIIMSHGSYGPKKTFSMSLYCKRSRCKMVDTFFEGHNLIHLVL